MLELTVKRGKEKSGQINKSYHGRPVQFIREVIKADPVPYQQEIIESLFKHHRLAVRSPHGAGKTSLSSWIILYALATCENDFKIITTASAWRQLSQFLWPEIHKWYRRADWSKISRKIELLTLQAQTDQGTAFAAASDRHELIEGAHASTIYCIFDEAKAIPDPTWDALEGAFSTGECYALAISTPGDLSGRFFDIHRRKPGFEDWKTRHIKLDECIKAGRISKDWVEARRRQWGESSPVFQARVLGEFPDQAEDALISLKWVEDAIERVIESKRDYDAIAGLDVAEFGSDDSAIVVRAGPQVLYMETWHGNDVMSTAGRAKAIASRYGAMIQVDEGFGNSVRARLQELDYPCYGVHFGASADDTEHFINKRAEMFWGLRERFYDGDISISQSPETDRLVGELTALKYKYSSSGKLQIESKADMRKRGVPSPDLADALALAFAHVDTEPLVRSTTVSGLHG